MNANVPQRITPLEQFRQQVLPPEKATELWKSLPGHIKPALFERNLLDALMANPDLMKHPPALIYREVSKAAGLGLLLAPLLGEAYIVPAWNGKAGRVEPQLRVGYKGMCKLARQAGDVTGIYAHEACQNDQFHCRLGTDKRIDHEPNMMADRGAVALYYAVIKFKDGTFDFDVMTTRDCQAIRDRSDAWRAFKDNKIKSTPWSTDEVEMSKKTVLRRLLKRQPQSPELAEAIKLEDEAEFPEMRAVARADDGPPPPSAITYAPVVTAPPISQGDAETLAEAGRHEPGEVVWGDPEGAGEAADDTAIPTPLIRDPAKLEAALMREITQLGTPHDCLHFGAQLATFKQLSADAFSRINTAFIARQGDISRGAKGKEPVNTMMAG